MEIVIIGNGPVAVKAPEAIAHYRAIANATEAEITLTSSTIHVTDIGDGSEH